MVYLDGEMPAELIKPRSRDALRRLKDAAVPRGTLLIFGRDIESAARRDFPTLPPFAPLNTEAGQKFLLALVDAISDVDLLIFDNVMSLVSGDQKDEVPWSETLPLVVAALNLPATLRSLVQKSRSTIFSLRAMVAGRWMSAGVGASVMA